MIIYLAIGERREVNTRKTTLLTFATNKNGETVPSRFETENIFYEKCQENVTKIQFNFFGKKII